MNAEFSHVSRLKGSHAMHWGLLRERETLGRFLHDLYEKLADKRCRLDADEDREFAYFDIKLNWDFDDIDICVHDGHVVVRMVRDEVIPVSRQGPCGPCLRIASP